MKTSRQKYRRRHWWKFSPWDDVFYITLIVLFALSGIFGLYFLIKYENKQKHERHMIDSVAMVDSLQKADSIFTVDSVLESDSTIVFDSVIDDTRVVVKSSHPVKISMK